LTDHKSSLITNSLVAIGDVGDGNSFPLPIFVLCERCYWCATYFDKIRVPRGNKCPECNDRNNNNNSNNNNYSTELTSLSNVSNESFTFQYSTGSGVGLEFKPRREGG
jgi:hypothetical protein